MKRHKALIPLSRDHHEALILSRLLQADAPEYKGLPTDAAGKADYASRFFEKELVEHFAEEETVFNLSRNVSHDMDVLITELVEEHEKLAKWFNALPTSSDLSNDLDQLGRLLESHIRKEERVLFPMMQEQLNEAILDSISKLTARGHEE